MRVTIYSTTTCPYCKALKDYLEEKGVEFKEGLIDQDEKAKKKMMEASGGFLGVPFTVVEKDDGSRETVVGFDRAKINEVLGIN